MTDNNTIKQYKKRGRKPKNYINLINNNITNIINENSNTEEEKIIYHIPLNPLNINDIQISESNINNNIDDNINSLFVNNITTDNANIQDNKSLTCSDVIYSTIVNNTINKISIYSININENTKCWWCKHTFTMPLVQLPENYTNNTFYCIGHFCSYNCAKSYNLDLNDMMTYKRNTLLNFLYYLTYKHNKNIISAPHWITLEDFGGILSITKFRENSIFNSKEYLILHPPIISRQLQIEESYKNNKLNETINKLNRLYSDIDSEYKNKSCNNNIEDSIKIIESY